jgi:hypothetical protein
MGPISGRVQGAAPHPTDAATLYVAADGGGVWKTTDATTVARGGPSWTALTDQQPSLAANAHHPIVVHPADGNLVLAVVSGPGGGLLKSLDAGATWARQGDAWFDSQRLTALAVDPTNTQVIYVGSREGAYKSTDGGTSWPIMPGLPGVVADLVVSRESATTLFAVVVGNSGAAAAQNGIYRSTDSGGSWHQVTGQPAAGIATLPTGPLFAWGPGTWTETARLDTTRARHSTPAALYLAVDTMPLMTPCATVYGTQEHITTRDASGVIWDAWVDGGGAAWQVQQLTGSGGVTSGTAADADPYVCVFGQQMHVVYRAQDGTIHDAWYDRATGTWSLQQLNDGGKTAGAKAVGRPSVSVYNDQLHVIYRDVANVLPRRVVRRRDDPLERAAPHRPRRVDQRAVRGRGPVPLGLRQPAPHRLSRLDEPRSGCVVRRCHGALEPPTDHRRGPHQRARCGR